MISHTAVRTDIPFLGLHYFDEEHETLFFGRDEQLRDLLAKLADSRFVTVIGSSGTGKSSLARAGLVPALRAGFFIVAGPKWGILKVQPGSSPIHNLAKGMEDVFTAMGVEVTLRRGPLGLVEAASQCGLGQGENLLILVDQFEEIFRYQREARDRQAAAEEASSFVKLLLEAAARVHPSVFVLITMRSDYLGACAQFRDLPERINRGLYLIPRMRRDQLEDAITGPAAVAGANFSPPLVQKLLNDAGEDPDQLPVLQHALLRTWLNWKSEENARAQIDFRHYEATGGVREGLDKHADEIFGKLAAEDKKIAEVLFRCLTERDPSNNDIRRPTELGVIADIADVRPDDVRRVADAFRGAGVSFLAPAAPGALDENTVLDITHESLIRKWYRLGGTRERKGWVQAEAEVREQYRELLKRARRALSAQDVLTGADLDAALDWRAQHLGPEWAQRYENAPDAFGIVSNYITRSERERQNQKRRRQRDLVLRGVTIILIFIFAAVYKVLQGNERDKIREAAIRSSALESYTAEKLMEEAKRAASEKALRKKAEDSAQIANEFRDLATARQLTSQAESLKDQDSRVEVSALLAIESLKRSPLPEGIAALRGPLALLRRPLWTNVPKRPKSANEENDVASDEGPGSSFPLLQFSSDGQYVARVGGDEKLHVYQVASGKELPLVPIPDKADSLAWDGNQLYLLALHESTEGDSYGVVFAISLTGGVVSLTGGLAKEVLRNRCSDLCLLTPDGKYLMVTETEEDGTGGQLLPLVGGTPLVLAKAGKIFAVGRNAGVLLRETVVRESRRSAPLSLAGWNNNSAEEIEGDSSSPIFDLAGNSGYLALVGQNRVVRIYRMPFPLTLLGQIVSPVDPVAVSLSPDGQLLAIADSQGGVGIFDWAFNARRVAWSHSSPAVAIAFSPDGKSVASLDQSGELRIIPLQEGSSVAGGNGPGKSTESLLDTLPVQLDSRMRSNLSASFDPTEHFLLVRQASSFAQLIDAARGTEVRLGPASASLLSTSDDGRHAAALSATGAVQIVDLAAGSATPLDKLGVVGWLVLSPAARYLAFRQGSINRANRLLAKGAPHIWDISRGSTSDLPVDTIAPVFSPDERWLVLRHAKTPGIELVRCGTWTIPQHAWNFRWRNSVPLFSHDGRFLFVTGFGSAAESEKEQPRNYLLVDTESNQEKILPLPEKLSVNSARFTPDGRLLAIASSDSVVRIFELPSGKLFAKISADFIATSMVFSHTSHYVGLVSGHAAPRVFQLPGGLEVSRAGLDENERLLAFHFSPDDRSLILATTTPVSGQADVDKFQEIFIKRQYLFAEELKKQGCSHLSRNLSPDEEWKHYLPDYTYEKTCPDLPVPSKR